MVLFFFVCACPCFFVHLFFDSTTVSPHKVKNQPFLLFFNIWKIKEKMYSVTSLKVVKKFRGKFCIESNTGFWVDALPKGPLGLYDTPDIPALILFQHVIISRRSRRLRDLLALEMFLLISAVHRWGTTELFLWIKYSKNTPPSPSSYLPVHLRSHGRVWAGPHSLTYQETRWKQLLSSDWLVC